MAKSPVSGWLHEPLAAVLGTRAKVAVLRVLWRAPTALPYREVVRRSGMAYGSVDLALGELTSTGLVEELPGGRERRVRLRPGHRLAASVSNLLQVDADYFPSLRVELRAVATSALADGLLAAAIVGAVTRRDERLGHDIEVVLITRDASSATRCRDRFAQAGDGIRLRFGVGIRLLGYDRETATVMWRTRTAAAIRDVRHAELLAGTPLEELLGS